jgi:hypothetical protein
LRENIKKLKEKKKGLKKIGGVVMDEEQFKAMLKQFNRDAPKRSRESVQKKIHTIAPKQESQSDFAKKEKNK